MSKIRFSEKGNPAKHRPGYRYRVEATSESRNLEPGKVHPPYVFQDDWCAIFKGGRCNCYLDIAISKGMELGGIL